MKEQDKYLILIHKRLTNQLSSAEAQELDTWLESDSKHRDLFELTANSWEKSLQYKSDYQPNTNAEWQKLDRKLTDGKVIAMPSRRRWWVVAAAVLLLAAAGFWWLNDVRTVPENWVNIETNERTKNIVLPDGSTVFLNKNTNLSYLDNFNEHTQRTVKMTGEAFFDVTKNDRPFVVSTDRAHVRVLGTSFNVKSRKETAIEVTVQSGKVQVSDTSERQKVVLQKGNQALLNTNGTLEKTIPDNLNALAWKTRQLEFNGMPLKEVLPKLGEYFDVNIDTNDLKANCLHSGDVRTGDKLEDTFKILEQLHGVKIAKTNKGYKVTSGKCF